MKSYAPHEQRVVVEKVELDDKISKLFQFFSNPIFEELPAKEQGLLKAQFNAMKTYSDLLDLRIAEF